MTLYIHVRNWDDWQNPDVTRGKSTRAPWIKDHLAQLNDEEWLALTLADRGLLQSLRLQYASNRGRGIVQTTSSLARVLGVRVTSLQIKRLNDAGFIEILPGKIREDSRVDEDEDVDVERALTADAVERDSSDSDQAASVADTGDEEQRKERKDEPQVSPAVGRGRSSLEEMLAEDVDEPPADSSSSSGPAPAPAPRPRDLLWDELERLFGSVAERTNARAKRNRAVADLRRLGATVELVRHAEQGYRRQYPGTPLTDTALATHYPQLTVGAHRQERAKAARCEACGMGGGLHVADCPTLGQERAA